MVDNFNNEQACPCQEMSMKMYDKVQIGANVPHDLTSPVEGADTGPLKGLDFMVKD